MNVVQNKNLHRNTYLLKNFFVIWPRSILSIELIGICFTLIPFTFSRPLPSLSELINKKRLSSEIAIWRCCLFPIFDTLYTDIPGKEPFDLFFLEMLFSDENLNCFVTSYLIMDWSPAMEGSINVVDNADWPLITEDAMVNMKMLFLSKGLPIAEIYKTDFELHEYFFEKVYRRYFSF